MPVLAPRETAAETWRYIVDRRADLMAPAGLLFSLNWVWGIYLSFFAPSGHYISPGLFGFIGPEALLTFRSSFFLTTLPNLVLVAITLSVLVTIHRQVLLGEGVHWRSLLWHPFTPRYAWLGFKLACISTVFVVVVVASAMTGIFIVTHGSLATYLPPQHTVFAYLRMVLILELATLPAALFLMWYLLALPAAALGEARPIKASTDATEGNWGRMVTLCLLVLGPLWVAGQVISLGDWVLLPGEDEVPPGFGVVIARIASSGLWAALETAEYCAAAVMLSLAYRRLVRATPSNPLRAGAAVVI